EGLAKCVAYYEGTAIEDRKLGGFHLPHHVLKDGEITLSYAGTMAAYRRLEQLKSLLEKKKVKTEINISEAESHIKSHLDFFENLPELKDKSEASFIDYVLEKPAETLQANPKLTDDEKRAVFHNAIEELLRRANWDLYFDYYVENNDNDVFNYFYKVDLVCESLKGKINELVNLLLNSTNNSIGGIKHMSEEIKKILAELSKEDAEGLIKTVVAMHNVNLKELNVEETYKEQVAKLNEDLEKTNEALSNLKDEYDVLKKEYEDYVAKVEAEKKEAEKAALATERIKELKDNGIDFSEERQKAVFAKLREMSKEEYEDYKAELLEVKAFAGSTKSNDSNNDDSDNDDEFDVKKGLAAFNIEYAKNKTVYDEYAELAEAM
ncbi:MAG: hypothetical protein ACTSYR_04135, partial [Candidatus Odinarchaeia archaeon]